MKKMKDFKMSFIASIICIIIPIFVGILLWDKLPSNMAIRFDLNGNPEGYCSKALAICGVFLFLLVIHIFVALITSLEIEKSEGIPDKLYGMILWICPIVSILVAAVIYSNSLGINIDVLFWCIFTVGFIFLILGNYIPKVRRNKLVGLRTIWTEESKKNWEHTARYSGFAMCVTGLISVIMAFIGLNEAIKNHELLIVWLLIVLFFVASMVMYSGNYNLKHKDEEDYFDSIE